MVLINVLSLFQVHNSNTSLAALGKRKMCSVCVLGWTSYSDPSLRTASGAVVLQHISSFCQSPFEQPTEVQKLQLVLVVVKLIIKEVLKKGWDVAGRSPIPSPMRGTYYTPCFYRESSSTRISSNAHPPLYPCSSRFSFCAFQSTSLLLCSAQPA